MFYLFVRFSFMQGLRSVQFKPIVTSLYYTVQFLGLMVDCVCCASLTWWKIPLSVVAIMPLKLKQNKRSELFSFCTNEFKCCGLLFISHLLYFIHTVTDIHYLHFVVQLRKVQANFEICTRHHFIWWFL